MAAEGEESKTAVEESLNDLDKNEDSLPSWMRYLPKTPWNSKQIHNQLHLQESSEEIQKRKLRKRRITNLPPSSNPFHVDLSKLEMKPGSYANSPSDDCENEHKSKRVRSARDGKQSSIDEMSMLISFCKVEKDV